MILSSISGRRSGNTWDKGLADAVSGDEFDEILEDVKLQWCKVESTQQN